MTNEKELGAHGATAGVSAEQEASDAATARHTPGPWCLITAGGRIPAVREIKRPHGEASHYRAVVSTNDLGGGTTIANLDFGYGSPENLANAHLIAAAPDMLEALKLIVDHFGDPLKVARAAIAKAEGR